MKMTSALRVKLWKRKIKKLRKKKKLSKKQLKKMIDLHVKLSLYDIERKREESEKQNI